MLILSRKEGESIQFGEDMEVKIIQITKGYVRIGIEAPKTLMILRKELSEEIRNKNLLSAEKDEVALEVLSKKIKQ